MTSAASWLPWALGSALFAALTAIFAKIGERAPTGPRRMRRVLVIGSAGAGKSTFAARLAARTGLPLIHLDAHFWMPGWVQTPKDEWVRRVDRLLAGERWVMDGNYGGTLERRLAVADTVILLDAPRLTCIARVLRRRLRYHGKARPDMTRGCPERITWEFLRWIWSYPAERRPAVLEMLERLGADQRVVILRSFADADAFLASLAPNLAPQPGP